MVSIRNLKDNGGSVFYPLTHERAVKDSNGVSLESKLAGLESQSYVEAWDGTSTPVEANIPAGVTVTYNTTTYTGTLAASASTIGKIYLVKNGNDYDRYITSQSGSTYSWVPVGSTQMDLSGYATDAELNQLQQEVEETYGEYTEVEEYVRVVTDNDGKILEGIKKDGTKVIGGDLHVGGNATINGGTKVFGDIEVFGKTYSIYTIDSPEYLAAWVDMEGKLILGLKSDGSTYISDANFFNVINEIYAIKAFLGNITGKSIDWNAFSFSVADSPEYISLILDKDNKILSGRTTDGAAFEKVGLATPKLLIGNADTETVNNPEFAQVICDGNGVILYGVKNNGEFIVGDSSFLKDIEALKTDIALESEKKHNTRFSTLIGRNEPRPLLYQLSGWYDKTICYPNGTIFYADTNATIKRRNIDGTISTLLTIEGATGYLMLQMDSHLNLYAAPIFNYGSDETNAYKTGVYKLPYGADSFEHVLCLYNPVSDIPSEITPNEFSVWTIAEDKYGELYAGIYGQPYCPYLYKSVDGGDTWYFLKDMSQYAIGGKHIHFIVYDKYQDALFCTVGEINKLLKSVDGGNTWIDTNVTLERMKSCSALVVEDGLILGSDYAYYGMMYKVYHDGSYRTTAKYWANVIFSIRESDLTGWIYAFGLIDAAVNEQSFYPTADALVDEEILQDWINSKPSHLSEWQEYHDNMIKLYPEDAIRPQHSAILISRDKGETWEILYRIDGTNTGIAGNFLNGECSFTLPVNNGNTIVISEGKHQYSETGISLNGEILSKLNNKIDIL